LYTVKIGKLAIVCCCDLDLDQMTFIYELDPYHVKLSLQSKNKTATFRLSKVIAIHNYLHTGRCTYRQMPSLNITMPLSVW